MDNDEFTKFIWQKSRELYREMPWRKNPTFYNVLVSEIMLQQTQVSRALVKFEEFMKRFPAIDQLANESLADVLRTWQGLGYNRRAKYLHETAKLVVRDGRPMTKVECMRFPGVGENTAGAIMAYVYNQPEVFIETNIRTVYLYHFFANRTDVTDRELRERVAGTIDHEHPREFYWALMDYGTWLKASGVRNIAASKHHMKQAPLKGSVREVRGQIIRVFSRGRLTQTELSRSVVADERFSGALDELKREGLVESCDTYLRLTK